MFDRSFGLEFEVGNEVAAKDIGKQITECQDGVKHPKKIVTHTGYQQSINNDYWHVKYDSSCGKNGSHGWEVASYVGKTQEELDDMILVAYFLEYHGCQVNNNCGFHIHVDASDFTERNMGILLARWIKIEPHLFRVVPNRRTISHYCRPLTKRSGLDLNKSYTPTELWQLLKPTHLQVYENDDKKWAINTVNYTNALEQGGNRKTVELRLPEGTLNPVNIRAWTYFFLKFVAQAKKASMPLDLKPSRTVVEFLRNAGLRDQTALENAKEVRFCRRWFLDKLLRSGAIARKQSPVESEMISVPAVV